MAEPDPQGFLILGAHPFARAIGSYLKSKDVDVLLADTNWANVAAARSAGLPAYFGSLLAEQADDEVRLSGLGKLLALTSNEEANALASLKYSRLFGSGNVYQLVPHHQTGARGSLSTNVGGRKLFLGDATFHDLRRLVDQGAHIAETDITEEFSMADFRARNGSQYIPLFIIRDDELFVLTQEDEPPEAGDTLVSLRIDPG